MAAAKGAWQWKTHQDLNQCGRQELPDSLNHSHHILFECCAQLRPDSCTHFALPLEPQSHNRKPALKSHLGKPLFQAWT